MTTSLANERVCVRSSEVPAFALADPLLEALSHQGPDVLEEDEASQYMREVARFFLALKGTGLFLSPLDAELVMTWFEAGLPLTTVLRGLHKGAVKKRLEGVRSLKRLSRYVSLEAKKLAPQTSRRRLERSSAPPAPPPGALSALLSQHRTRLHEVRETALEANLLPLANLVTDVLQMLPDSLEQANWDAGGPVATFLRVGRRFYDELLPLLPEEDRTSLLEKAQTSLRGMSARMAPDAFADTVQELVLTYVRERFELFEPKDIYSLWDES